MSRPTATRWRLAAVLAAATLVSACGLAGSGGGSPGPGGLSGSPVTIGVSLPLSGALAPEGVAFQRGYQLWAASQNQDGGLLGHPVALRFADDRGSGATTAADYTTLISADRVNLTLGPPTAALVSAAGRTTARFGFALLAGETPQGRASANVFAVGAPTADDMQAFANWVLRLRGRFRPRTAAYPLVNDPVADPPVRVLEQALRGRGIRPVFTAPAFPDTSRTALIADARRVAAKRAQLVVLGTPGVPELSAFIAEFARLRYNPKLIIASAGPDQGQTFLNKVGAANAGGIMVPGDWYPGQNQAVSQTLVQDYIARYGGISAGISSGVAQAYAAGQVLATAVTATGGVSNRAIISYLHSGPQDGIETVQGTVKFGPGPLNVGAPAAAIYQWQNIQGTPTYVRVLPRGRDSVPVKRVKPRWGA